MTIEIDNDITFRKLSIFMAFMDKGNIARTAEVLNMSTVGVHRALHTLEEGVKCPLFAHKGRNLVAEPAAWILLEYCQKVMQTMQRGLEETRRMGGIGQGRLRLGTLYSLTLETVPHLIMGMKLRRPDLEMDLTMNSNRELLNMLEDNVLDAILISVSEAQIDHKAMEMISLFHDDIYLAAPSAERVHTKKDIDLSEYSDRKFIALAEGFATYTGFQDACRLAGFEPEVITRVNDIFSMLSLVQAGVGLSLVPGRMKRLYEKDVQLLRLAEPYRMRQQIAIVFPRNREHDPNLLALAAEGRMYARRMPFYDAA